MQADARSFLHAGDHRTEAEIKSFMHRWVVDAFTWTPLDVEDRLRAALRVVDPKAQPVVKEGLRLGAWDEGGFAAEVPSREGAGTL